MRETLRIPKHHKFWHLKVQPTLDTCDNDSTSLHLSSPPPLFSYKFVQFHGRKAACCLFKTAQEVHVPVCSVWFGCLLAGFECIPIMYLPLQQKPFFASWTCVTKCTSISFFQVGHQYSSKRGRLCESQLLLGRLWPQVHSSKT